ncbi:uncharacterized protein LOC116620342 [Nematostella vectensis]|uniref:uncharacterized protein LOC116620342 n=1 Tax=Nematostella vectensis TaxID=45351 RepID=UPI00138FA7B5|nr:uncharacterized protein LOC116620342 [Nematostella vectensis]
MSRMTYSRSLAASVCALLISLKLKPLQATDCKTRHSEFAYSLDDSYQSELASNYPQCITRCLWDTNCESVTYDLIWKACKLSNQTRWTRPSLFTLKENHIYMEMLRANVPLLVEEGGSSSNYANYCSSRREGDYRHPEDCSKYITCAAGGYTHIRDCGSNMRYNPISKVCDFPNNVNCH